MKATEDAKEILGQQTTTESFKARARGLYLLAAWRGGSKRASRAVMSPGLDRGHCPLLSIPLANASHKASPTQRLREKLVGRSCKVTLKRA